MSGHDETFLPPDGEDEKLPPYPPTPAPPHFGQASAGEPAVAFQAADTQPGDQAFSGPSAASDAEETMIPPLPKRSGGPTPDSQNPATAPYDMTAAPPRTSPYGAAPEAARPPVDFPPPPLGPRASDPQSGPGTREAAFPPGPPPYATPAANVPPYGSPLPSDPIPEAERTAADGLPPRSETPSYGAPAPGAPFPDVEHTMTNGPGSPAETPMTPPYGPAGGTTPPGVPPYGSPAPGDPIPDAEPAMAGFGPRAETPATPPYGPAGGTTPPGAPPYGSPIPGEEPAMAAEAGGQTVTFTNGQATLALARFGTEAAPGTPGPELTPDAILPPGTPLQAPPEPPPPDPAATSTGPIPRLGSGASFPGGPAGPSTGSGPGGSSGARRALLVGGGLVAALVLGGGGALAVTELSGSSHKEHKTAQSAPPPAPTPPAPTPTPSPTKAKHKPKHVPVDIRDEKKDPKPLTISEVFPSRTLTLAGHKFVLAKTVINDHCSLAANGPFATELTREHCRRVVRATFVSDDKKLAVTTGIAVMPTDAAARGALKAQDPSHYKWFRGMKATGAPKIDQAGGYAASTLRGRYISYAYATYVDAHKPAKGDNTLKTVGTAFRDSTARPITRRAKH